MRATTGTDLPRSGRSRRRSGAAGESLRRWVAQSEVDRGRRDGVSSDERIKELEREVRELRQANEILKKASAYFAQAELDRPLKR